MAWEVKARTVVLRVPWLICPSQQHLYQNIPINDLGGVVDEYSTETQEVGSVTTPEQMFGSKQRLDRYG